MDKPLNNSMSALEAMHWDEMKALYKASGDDSSLLADVALIDMEFYSYYTKRVAKLGKLEGKLQ